MLKSSEVKEIPVWRGSTVPEMILNDDLVVGDVYGFELGNKYPADSVML